MKEGTKANKYRPTRAQNKLLTVMLIPENRHLSITDTCIMAKCNRSTYYKAFDNSKFVAYYKKKSKDLVDQAVMPAVNALIKGAKGGSHPHLKMLLEMAEMHADVRHHQLTGKDGGPIETKGATITGEMSPKEASTIYSQLVKNE